MEPETENLQPLKKPKKNKTITELMADKINEPPLPEILPELPRGPEMLPDLQQLAWLGKDIAEYADYVQRNTYAIVADMRSNLDILREEDATLDQEHEKAMQALIADYQAKKRRNRNLQQRIENMVTFYTKNPARDKRTIELEGEAPKTISAPKRGWRYWIFG